MNKTKTMHTQEPWRARKLADHWWEVTSRGVQIAELRGDPNLDDDGKAALEADALLLAASPRLFRACRALVDAYDISELSPRGATAYELAGEALELTEAES